MKKIALITLFGISLGCAMDAESTIKPLGVHNRFNKRLLFEDQSIDSLAKPYSNCSIHINMLKEKAYDEAIKKGIKKGRKKVKLETALALLGMDFNDNDIIKATRLRPKQLEKLKKKS